MIRRVTIHSIHNISVAPSLPRLLCGTPFMGPLWNPSVEPLCGTGLLTGHPKRCDARRGLSRYSVGRTLWDRSPDRSRTNSSGEAGKASPGLAGAVAQGETPDPIPNSAVKSLGPMVVLVGESRSVPAFLKAGHRKVAGLRLFYLSKEARIKLDRLGRPNEDLFEVGMRWTQQIV